MMKTILFFIATVLCLIVATGCTANESEMTSEMSSNQDITVATEAVDIPTTVLDDEPTVDTDVTEQEPEADIDVSDNTVESSDSEEGIEFKAEFESYPVGTESIKVIVTNNGESPLTYGAQFMIQMLVDGEWEYVPFNSDFTYVFEDVEYELAGGESQEHTVSLHCEYYDYTAGTYRVVDGDMGAEFKLV